MSKVIASVAISGAYKIVEKAEAKWKMAMEQWGANEPIGFPNTAYYLPVIYGMLGYKVEKLGDIEFVLKKCRALAAAAGQRNPSLALSGAMRWMPGMATFFAEEIIEAIRYRENPRYYVSGEDVTPDNIWLGAADDVILRKRGVEFVDGTAPGFAAILGAAPTPQIAANIAHELQQKNLYVFMSGENGGKRFAEQLVEAGVQIGWGIRLVPFGPDVNATVFALGFATRAAMSFGGIEPGDYRKLCFITKTAFLLS